MDVAVKFENVSKRFILHPQRPRSLQETVIQTLKGNRSSKQELWALKDLTFEVQEGEILGIVGPNGAGKSTLLNLMARILDATSGRMTVNGKVAALLELGTGFHPDLTGRENIFLNGSLLGLSRRDMLNKFDEIVEFAELAQFIDVPVYHYSSGMLIRLGFSIATNVDPDILLIDEVLAVGDQHFQAKCLARMEEIKERETTI
ncbi:MAG: ABC transporter ATP-binding protein, partial [Anaerolineae bacterium]|nr:ABC transporter ATP-binding protein [Anaerolineae bacterium]